MTDLKKVIAPLVLFIFFFSFAGGCFSAEKPHKENILSKDEALNLLKDLVPNLKILEVRTIPVKGLWEVDIEAGKRKGIVYIDFSKKYMIQGAVFDIKAKTNLTQERFVEINKVDVSQIPLDDALVMGNKDAKHRVIVFDDPD
jgi:thiol:disulfide interchange protein DsbC